MSLQWLPNALSWLRILTAPVIGVFIYLSLGGGQVSARAHFADVAFYLFVAAALTDWLDGFAARKLNAASDLGAKLDLWGDKILVASALLAILPTLPLLACFGLITLSVRDIYIMRLRAKHPDVNLKATFLAKSKTAIIMAAMALCLFGYAGFLHAMPTDEATMATMRLLVRLGLSMFVFGCVLSLGTALQYVQAASRKA